MSWIELWTKHIASSVLPVLLLWLASACGDDATSTELDPTTSGPAQTAGTAASGTGGVSAAGAAGAAGSADGAAGAAGASAAGSNAPSAGATGAGAGGVPAMGGRDAGLDAGMDPQDAASSEDAGPDAGSSDGCDIGVHDGTTPQPLRLSGNTFAHDPTMIEVDGVFYRFWTGNNIPMATSTDLMRWQDGPPVYRNGYSQWTRDWLASVPNQEFNFPWAPDVSYFGGRYHLYSSFSARFGRNISCITHLTTTDIASGNWTDHGPVICTDGDERYNAIDADVGFDAEGNPYLAFGSFWDGIMAFPLDQNGDRVGSDLTRLASASQIEAPVLFRRCGYHYLFVSWGLCCPGEGRSVEQLSYRVVVGRSQNILGPYVDREGRALVDGGGTLVVQGDGRTFAAAGHSDILVSGDTIYHLYHAYRLPSGNAELRIVELPFDEDGWPVPTGP